VSEIAAHASAFVERAARDMNRPVPAIGAEIVPMLEAYAWPGNIRELRNMMERAVLLCGTGPIGLAHLPVEKMRTTLAPHRTAPLAAEPPPVPPPARPAAVPPPAPDAERPLRDAVRAQVEALERQRICDALARAAGNQSAAAKLLGMPRRTLVKRLAAYNIPRPRRGSTDA
jgi:DNA-binding NtrC family response regulator